MVDSSFSIVDNSQDELTALRYLRDWCEISRALDIASGYFDVGALLALDGQWQKLEKIRILLGDDLGHRTAKLIERVRAVLDASAIGHRVLDPFLSGLDAIVMAIANGKIEIRVYSETKFHAKTYITHARLDVVGSAALVGSSNLTLAGLTKNVELNVEVKSGPEVRELQAWYEKHWAEGIDIRDHVIEVAERHAREFSPYEVYAKALKTLTENVDPGATEWERTQSRVYPGLSPYQREAYHGLKQRAARWGGAFLTDGVGLGKTYVGLMLAEYFAVKEQKNVLVMATKTGRDAVWNPLIAKLLPKLTGEFTNLFVMAHTDLSKDDAPGVVERLAERVSVVIIDEAHNFRNRGSVGDDPDLPSSRWRRLERICRGKTVFNLTATPINNSLYDFVHQFELFTGLEKDAHFASLGVPSVRAYFNALERSFYSGFIERDLRDFGALIAKDSVLAALIVQNSRKYAIASAKKSGGPKVLFPKPAIPRAVPYEFDAPLLALLDEIERAFERRVNPLFILPFYYPLAYSRDPRVDPFKENRQRQVVGLIRSVFLKRFESSVAAFAGSCVDLSRKILRSVLTYSVDSPGADADARAWNATYGPMLTRLDELLRHGLEIEEVETDSDALRELLDELPQEERLDDAGYRLDDILRDAQSDLDQLGRLIQLALAVVEGRDSKYEQLRKLLTGRGVAATDDAAVFAPRFVGEKVIVFTEFADTARYLAAKLTADGVADLDRIDGSRSADRVSMIRRFAPFYNDVPADERANAKPLRVLISTDVLSEGVNLQDSGAIVNYDIHWNPVRLMQRIGRVDRRLNEEVEAEIVSAQPGVRRSRGRIEVRNFLPSRELSRLIALQERVEQRVQLISRTLGIPGGKLLDKDDLLDDVKVFKAFLDEYEGTESPLELLRLEYLDMCNEDPGLEDRLGMVPSGAYSAKAGRPVGTFICTIEPIRVPTDDGGAAWTREGGTPRWEYVDANGERSTDVLVIERSIRSAMDEPRLEMADRGGTALVLRTLRDERYRELLKDLQLPLNAPRPETVCWMQVR